MSEEEREEGRSRKVNRKIKCVLCGAEAEYIKDGMSLCEKHFKAQQIGDKEIDLVKIQIYADKCHTFLTAFLSLGFVVLGLWAVFATLYYQGLFAFNFPFINAGYLGMGVISILAFIVFWISFTTYNRDSRKISKMIEAVKKGEQLPALDKLGKWDC
jgi:hypothetical protein